MTDSFTSDALIQHAHKNIWSAPDPERQANYKLARLTPAGGAWQTMEVYWRDVAMPDKDHNFHVYQMGRVHSVFNAQTSAATDKWINCSAISGNSNTTIVLYDGNGIIVPRHQCFMLFTKSGGLLIAVNKAVDSTIAGLDLDGGDLYVRLYTNTRYTRPLVDLNGLPALVCGGERIASAERLMQLQNHITTLRQTYPVGVLTCTINGRYSEFINTAVAKIGDYVDWEFDTTVTDIIDFKISGLKKFMSTLDNESKFILSHNEDIDHIQYHDDIDIYVVVNRLGVMGGTLLHKRKVSITRMLTHRDYAISEASINAVLTAGGYSLNEAYVRFVFHDTDKRRELVHEVNRIHELYRLGFADRYSALAAEGTAPAIWHAKNLESSPYIQVMSAPQGRISRGMVEGAYGYNALSTFLGKTPGSVYKHYGQNVVDIPVGLQRTCTGYEYDKDGLLCAVGISKNNIRYHCVNDGAVWVELIYGEGNVELDYVVNNLAGTYSELHNYRFYLNENGEWADVTNTDLYTSQYGEWTFPRNPEQKTMVLSNAKHLFRSFKKPVSGGVLQFDIQSRVNRYDMNVPIALGSVEVFLNLQPLVEGVDYIVNWPTVTITNKTYLRVGTNVLQDIAFRAGGFCNGTTMMHEVPEDVGFLVRGVMSGNRRYDIHDDRVLSIVGAGAMYERSEIMFAEDSNGVYVPNAMDGYPYAIRDIVVPMNNYLVSAGDTPSDATYELRRKARVIDDAVSNFLSARFPQPDLTVGAPKIYHVYSPFFSKILTDLASGYLFDDAIEDRETITEETANRILKDYLPLLNSDPLRAGHESTRKMAVIDAHCFNTKLELTVEQRLFVDRVELIYGDGLISVANFVTVKS